MKTTLALAAILVLAGGLAVLPTAQAGPDCYDIYNEWTVGPVTVIQRSSCSYEVCIDGECDLLQ